jgi:CheY-like chemotaxis protein
MARKRVLVVDDELPFRNLLTNLLGRLGHTAEAASSAAEALSKIEGAEFDLILTDFNMPGMKGDELAHEIKKRKQGMPVVLATSGPPENLSQDIDRVLLKPFSVQELIETIASLT